MATFTSVTSGNWNDGATWGKTSPGVKGTDWPGNAGDVVNIGTTAGQAHVVTYNVSEVNELGQITIGALSGSGRSMLDFATNMSTKLTLGHQDIACQFTGELRIGTAGAVLNKAYTAEIVWTPTANNIKGLSFAAGSKFTLYGDPDYYGSDFDTSLYSSWNGSDLTIYLAGDFSGKWLSGQELLIHKGGAYGTTGYINDFALVSINGAITYDGTKSTVPIAIVHVPSPGTFATGGDVLNVSRNIMLYPAGYSHNIFAIPTNMLRVSNLIVTSGAININNVQASGWYTFVYGWYVNANSIVCRNGGGAIKDLKGGAVTNIIVYSSNYAYGSIYGCYGVPISGYVCAGSVAAASQVTGCWTPDGQSLKIFGSVRGFNGHDNRLTVYNYSNSIGFSAPAVPFNSSKTVLQDGAIGYNQSWLSCPNTTDLDFLYCCDTTLINVKLQTRLPSVANRNSLAFPGRYSFEHYNQAVNEHCIMDAYGDIVKTPADGADDNPTQRSGGNDYVIEVTPQPLCDATCFLKILNVRLWAIAGVSKTYRFYVQTDFVTLPTAELKLYGEYLDEVSGGHLATVASTQGIAARSNASDWSQYVEVTLNPTQTGYVNLCLRLMGYEAGKRVWIDPKPEGVAMIPRWSCGEVVLEPITASGGGSVSPTNLGLVPLGIKQVAI